MKLKALVGVLAVAGLAMPGIASATNGYFSHGYGMTAKGMGGAATAMAKDAFGGANNPASMVWVGDRMDIGIDWFSPIRSAERTGALNPTANGKVDSGSENFFVPEFGYNMMLGDKMSLGVTVYGNGGMNSDYSQGNFNCGAGASNILCGSGKLGVDLMQLIIAPTVAYKVNPNHSIGISPLLGYQRFKAEGLQAFTGATATNDPANVTNNGYDSSTGWGVRIGYMGKLSDSVSIGAAYATKMSMSEFDKYKGLFAENGGFDMPENWNLGIAFKASPTTTVALDYQRINYSGVKSISNPSTNFFDPTGAGMLGKTNGAGFGWGDVDVVKLGVEYAYSPKLTMRAGYSHSDNPIQARDVTFNILAPGVVTDHFTLGFTYGLDKDSEITMAYMHANSKSVTGASLLNSMAPSPTGGAGSDKIEMYENSLGIAYGKKF